MTAQRVEAGTGGEAPACPDRAKHTADAASAKERPRPAEPMIVLMKYLLAESLWMSPVGSGGAAGTAARRARISKSLAGGERAKAPRTEHSRHYPKVDPDREATRQQRPSLAASGLSGRG